MPDYPWWDVVEGDAVEQGDLLTSCRVFRPALSAADVSLTEAETPNVPLRWLTIDAIVLSQSCDLVLGKVNDVLLCAAWPRAELANGLSSARGIDGIRRGHVAHYHLLPSCQIEGLTDEVRVVDFKSVYTLPLDYFRRVATLRGKRRRLLSRHIESTYLKPSHVTSCA